MNHEYSRVHQCGEFIYVFMHIARWTVFHRPTSVSMPMICLTRINIYTFVVSFLDVSNLSGREDDCEHHNLIASFLK